MLKLIYTRNQKEKHEKIVKQNQLTFSTIAFVPILRKRIKSAIIDFCVVRHYSLEGIQSREAFLNGLRRASGFLLVSARHNNCRDGQHRRFIEAFDYSRSGGGAIDGSVNRVLGGECAGVGEGKEATLGFSAPKSQST